MGPFDLYDDAELARAFGTGTLDRGRDYVRRGHVLSCEVSDANPRITLVHGNVRGSGRRPYSTTVTLAEDPSGGWLDSRCTCPVIRMCKHAAALMLVAGAAPGRDDGGARDWERRLALVLDELDEAAEATTAERRPLALQVELTPARTGGFPGRPPAGRAVERHPEPAARRGSLRLRPVQRGARDNWVKSGVAWTDVPYLDGRSELDPDQVAVLGELLTAHRAANRQSYYGAESHLSMSTFGPSLWALLDEARRVGLSLVPAGLLRGVEVAPDPVSLRLDVNAADTDRAHLRLGVAHGDEWYAGDRLEVLGGTGHGDEARARAQRAHRRQMRRAGLAGRSGDDEHPAEVSFVRIGSTRWHQVPHSFARKQFEKGPLELVDDVIGNADVGDDHVAGVRFGRRQHQRQLGCAERHRDRGFDRCADLVGGIGAHPRWQVDRHDRHAGLVDVGDDSLHEAGERRRQAGAEDRIDDQIVSGNLGAVELPRLFVGDLHHGLSDVAEDRQIGARVAFHFAERADDEDRHVEAALLQRAGHHEAVAAVVALAADDGDAALGEILVEGFNGRDHLAAGILHEDQRRDADVLDRPSIGLTHLVSVEDAHLSEL